MPIMLNAFYLNPEKLINLIRIQYNYAIFLDARLLLNYINCSSVLCDLTLSVPPWCEMFCLIHQGNADI